MIKINAFAAMKSCILPLPMRPSTLGRLAVRGFSLSMSSSWYLLNAMAKFLALTAQIVPKISSLKPNQAEPFSILLATIIATKINGRAKTECLKTMSSAISFSFLII